MEYCPTGDMIADYFTKPLQGTLFRKFREVIMGWKHISTLEEFLPANKERLGNNEDIEQKEIIEKKEEKEKKIKKVTYADIVRSGGK